MDKEHCVALKQVQDALNVERPTLYKLFTRYNIPTYRFPGDRQAYIAKTDMDRMLQGRVSRQPK